MLIHYFSWYIFYSLTSRELLISRTHTNTIFCRSMMRSSRWIEMNCFNIFRFLAEVSTHLKKMHYFRQFKNHLTPFFSSAFWPLTKLIAKINFHGSYFCPFWSAKYLNFGGVSFEISILSRSIQETYTLRKVKKQVLPFLSSWEPIFFDLMVYFCLFQNTILHRLEAKVLKF